MDRVDVITAVQVIIDEDFPVAGQLILAALDEKQHFQPQRRGPFRQRCQEFRQRLRPIAHVDENQGSPGGDVYRQQTFHLAAEIGRAVELGSAAQPAGQVVGPTVIAAAEAGIDLAASQRSDSGSSMAANVKKRPKHAVEVAQPGSAGPRFPG